MGAVEGQAVDGEVGTCVSVEKVLEKERERLRKKRQRKERAVARAKPGIVPSQPVA